MLTNMVENDSSLFQLPEDIADHLLALFDTTGYFKPNEHKNTDPLELTVQTLRHLDDILATLHDNESSPCNESSPDDTTTERLHQLEAHTLKLRNLLKGARQCAKEDIEEVFIVRDEIDELLTTNENMMPWKSIVRAIVSNFCSEIISHDAALSHLQRILDDFHLAESKTIREMLVIVTHSLDRIQRTKQMHFQGYTQFLRPKHAILPETVGSTSSQNITNAKPLISRTQPIDFSHPNNAFDAVSSFLKKARISLNPQISSLLVVGPEGSGKSHLCGRVAQTSDAISKLQSCLYRYEQFLIHLTCSME